MPSELLVGLCVYCLLSSVRGEWPEGAVWNLDAGELGVLRNIAYSSHFAADPAEWVRVDGADLLWSGVGSVPRAATLYALW